jgi:opacity protein-like surface antigen
MQLKLAIVTAGIAVFSAASAVPLLPPAFQSAELSPANAPLNPAGLTLNPAAPGIWSNEVGSGLSKGTTEVGLLLGMSIPWSLYANATAHDLALTKLLAGYVLSDVLAKDHWFRGQWEMVGELFGGGQYNPQSHYLYGVTSLLRYEFVTGTRFVPFCDAGIGATSTDIGLPDLGGNFQFNDQAGVGVHWFFRNNLALTLQYRVIHFSNGGLASPNHGVNTTLLSGGVSYFF